MIIDVNNEVFLSPYEENDVDRLVVLLKDETIALNTFIPIPYTMEDARDWIQFAKSEAKANQHPLHFAIRQRPKKLIGGIGLKKSNSYFERHLAEVGYWLGKPYRNQSIVSSALKVFSQWVFQNLSFVKLYAPILKRNIASQRAAEKAGYTFEAELKKQYLKDDQYLDGVIYSYFKFSS